MVTSEIRVVSAAGDVVLAAVAASVSSMASVCMTFLNLDMVGHVIHAFIAA